MAVRDLCQFYFLIDGFNYVYVILQKSFENKNKRLNFNMLL